MTLLLRPPIQLSGRLDSSATNAHEKSGLTSCGDCGTRTMTIRSAMHAIRRHPRGHRSTPALLAALLLAATAIDAAAPNHTPAAHSNLLEASIDNVVGTPDDLIFVNGFDPAAAAVVYRYDDGDGNANQGPPSAFDPDMLWGNYYLVQTGGEVITEISVAFGPTFPTLAD